MAHTAILRKVGGSVMLAIPPALLDVTELTAGRQVSVFLSEGRLVIEPAHRPRYSLAELLSQCDGSAAVSAEDRDWLSSSRAGKELL